MVRKKIGKLTLNGVVPKPHEMEAIDFLTELGYDIKLIPTSKIKGIHSPDFMIDRQRWELKSPTGNGKYLIPNTIQRAVKQSGNVIIDLRKTKRNQERCIRELRKELKLSGSLKRVKVITKEHKLLEL